MASTQPIVREHTAGGNDEMGEFDYFTTRQ